MSPETAEKGALSGEISASRCAERLGLTTNAVGQWCSRPGAPVRRDGSRVWVRWPDFARWREQEMQKTAKGSEETAGFAARMAAANARAAEVRLAQEEIALSRAQGAVVDVADLDAVVGKILDRMMAVLRSFPGRFPELGEHAQQTIEAEVERAVEQLAAFDEDLLEEPVDADDPPAADDDEMEEAA